VHYSTLVAAARGWLVALTLVALTLAAGDVQATANAERLFCIYRSVNANVVCYDVRLLKDGRIDIANPLDVYWILRAEKGQRERLGFFERKLAYGYSLLKPITNAGFDFVLRAAPNRRIQVRRFDGALRAVARLSGRPSRLTSIYVQVEKTSLGPKVLYVLLRGIDLSTHKKRQERVEP
jgi:hypothetical protein